MKPQQTQFDRQQFTVVFQRQQKYDKNFWVELLLLVEKLEIGIKNGIGFCAVYFCLTVLIKICFFISIFLCFALVPKLVPRTVDFHWYWYRILKFWYRDNTKASYSESMRFCKIDIHISNKYAKAVQADDVGHQRCVISDERGERTKQNASHELETQNEDL